jgi:hypothetical protein
MWYLVALSNNLSDNKGLQQLSNELPHVIRYLVNTAR